MSISYSKDVDLIMGTKLKEWIIIIKKDRCFIDENHEIKWSEIRAEINRFIRRFIFEILRVDGEYDYCEPISNRKRSINSFITEIEELLSKFESSPPFTIHYFIQILSMDEELNCFPNYEINEQFKGLKEYTRRTVDLIAKTETEVIVNNVYFEENGEYIVPSMNKMHAIKYLKLLIKCLSVESNCIDVRNDMKSYKSSNILMNKDVEKEDVLSDEENAMKLVKIDW